ncbi:VTT domain-containing protein [Micromonospora sp. NPDC050686]|uniref:VTT domain-containing protein n=1 Tax=Micromonospora sp. NPDC050686 TaxID=3154631 RepID=UPI0033E715B7
MVPRRPRLGVLGRQDPRRAGLAAAEAALSAARPAGVTGRAAPAATGQPRVNTTFSAAVSAGRAKTSYVGYLFGRRVGPALFRRPDSRLFRQQHVARANRFFARHGARSLVLARFVPVVRTFTPIVAGVSRMRYRTFFAYNVVGGLLWGVGVTVLGFFLGRIAFVRANIEFILIGIVVVSVLPIAVQLLRSRHRAAARQQGVR